MTQMTRDEWIELAVNILLGFTVGVALGVIGSRCLRMFP